MGMGAVSNHLSATKSLATGDMNHLEGTSVADIQQRGMIARPASVKGEDIAPEEEGAPTRAPRAPRCGGVFCMLTLPPVTLSARAFIKKRRSRGRSVPRRSASESAMAGEKDVPTEQAPKASRCGFFGRMTLPPVTLNALAAIKERRGRRKSVPRRSLLESATDRSVRSVLESSTVENEHPQSDTSVLKSLVNEIKEKERASITTGNRSASERSVMESKQNQRSLIATKSRSSSERSITESKRRSSSISNSGSKVERDVKKNRPPEKKASVRYDTRGTVRSVQRSSGSSVQKSDERSDDKSASKLPPETKASERHGPRDRSTSIQRSGSSRKVHEKKSNSLLPSETKEAEQSGRARGVQRSSSSRSSKSYRKAGSKISPETKALERHGRVRSRSVQRTCSGNSNTSDEKDDNKLPPETQTRKDQTRRRSLSIQRGENTEERRKYEVHTQDEPSDGVEAPLLIQKSSVARRKVRRQSATSSQSSAHAKVEMKASIEAFKACIEAVRQNESGASMSWDAYEQADALAKAEIKASFEAFKACIEAFCLSKSSASKRWDVHNQAKFGRRSPQVPARKEKEPAPLSVAVALRKVVVNPHQDSNASIQDLDDTSPPDAQLMKTLKTYEQLRVQSF